MSGRIEEKKMPRIKVNKRTIKAPEQSGKQYTDWNELVVMSFSELEDLADKVGVDITGLSFMQVRSLLNNHFKELAAE